MSGKIIFKGSNFVVVDITAKIHSLRGRLFPYGSRGQGPKHCKRSLKDITHVNVHQTYGNIIKGGTGALATADFLSSSPIYKCEICKEMWGGKLSSSKCTDHKPSKHRIIGGGRGFPKMSYHVWIPYYTEQISTGEHIIYFCVPFDERSWQGSESNQTGVALVNQGRFYSRHLGSKFCPWPGTTGGPSQAQKEVFHPVLHEWLFPTLKLEPKQITGHFHWGKKTCPGDYYEREILWLRGDPIPNDLEKSLAYFEDIETNPLFNGFTADVWKNRQKALYTLGFALDEITGVPDDATKSALLALQTYSGIEETGCWDEDTEIVIMGMLQQLGIFDLNSIQ